MNSNNTIVGLAGVAAPLPLYSGSMATFLGITRFINDSNCRWMRVFIRYYPLKFIPKALVIPWKYGQETLQSARRHVGRKSNWLNALSRQVGQLAIDIGTKILPRAATAETVIKLGQKYIQFFANTFDLLDIHIDSPYKHHAHKRLSTLLSHFLELYSRCSIKRKRKIQSRKVKQWNWGC
jgi:hypothetical protein